MQMSQVNYFTKADIGSGRGVKRAKFIGRGDAGFGGQFKLGIRTGRNRGHFPATPVPMPRLPGGDSETRLEFQAASSISHNWINRARRGAARAVKARWAAS